MTWQSNKLKIPKPKPGKIVTPESLVRESEGSSQSALFAWAALNLKKYPMLEFMAHVPNGGSRHIREAVNLKAQGVKAGLLDIVLFYPMDYLTEFSSPRTYHGLLIEMKTAARRTHKNGGCSDEQMKWIEYLTANGYCVRVCYSWIEARDVILNYLEGKL